MNVADLNMHNVAKVTINPSKTLDSAVGHEFTTRDITIELTDGSTVTVQLFAKGEELKVEIN